MPDDVTQVHKLAGLTPSETLRAGAARLRELAAKATPAPWEAGERCVFTQNRYFEAPVADGDAGSGGISNPHDAEWIATMSPVVAEPLARELEMHAGWLRTIEDLDGDRSSMGKALAVERARHMLAFARSILEQP